MIFNVILNTGNFPVAWTKGILVPLYKKGDKSDVKKYRDITLLSNFAKLFTCVLNQRISKWCEENNTISDAQFGFRKGRSTEGAVFVLHTIIENYEAHDFLSFEYLRGKASQGNQIKIKFGWAWNYILKSRNVE